MVMDNQVTVGGQCLGVADDNDNNFGTDGSYPIHPDLFPQMSNIRRGILTVPVPPHNLL